mgnify:CR=1 FL=1
MKSLLLICAVLPNLLFAETQPNNNNQEPQQVETQLTQAQIEQMIREQQAAIEYYERMMRIQQYMAIRGMAYPVPMPSSNFGISQQIGNMKYNFNSNGVSTEQTIGNKTFTNGPN